ncbi:HAD family hydrolase [Geminicoccus harenae]|uniref:HAD family hydrolase n=1 Tax=Geminicoccus harenae TaxID=2498453 RepID=UPI001C93DBEC|nr:HAD family hydrolase [Geminicoccus harenae]
MSMMDRLQARPRVVALDGDDTLWHNETMFVTSHERFRALLLRHVDLPPERIDAWLLDTERRNLKTYGYGIKGFVLSMVETAIEATGGRIPAGDIAELLRFGRAMLDHPVELIGGAEQAIEALRQAGCELWLVTKGDLFDQESKIARSGLAERFDRIEILSEKDTHAYRRLLARHGVAPEEFVMAGNSLRSDVLPVSELGGLACYVPYHLTWAHEQVGDPGGIPFLTLRSLRELPDVLRRLPGADCPGSGPPPSLRS